MNPQQENRVSVAILVFFVLLIVASAVIGSLGANALYDAQHANDTAIFAPTVNDALDVIVYEDFSGVITYADYAVHFADDGSKVEIWVSVNSTYADTIGCDALSLDQQYCIFAGDDTRQEFAKVRGLW